MNESIKKLIASFKEKFKEDIRYSNKRGRCALITPIFSTYAKDNGFAAKRVSGYFHADTPSLKKIDFTEKEILEMLVCGLNPNKKADRLKYAEAVGLIEVLKNIPHSWNEIDGNVIDFTARNQFIRTKLSPDMNQERYIKDKEF